MKTYNIKSTAISRGRCIYCVYKYAFGYVIMGQVHEVPELLNINENDNFDIEYKNLDSKRIVTVIKFNRQIHSIKLYDKEDCLPLGVLLSTLKKGYFSRFVVNGQYERYPATFKDATSYKCWLQSAFAEFGWGIWDDLIFPEESSYGMDKAVYTACLKRNNGRAEDFKVPTANSIFEELEKLEVREGIKQRGA